MPQNKDDRKLIDQIFGLQDAGKKQILQLANRNGEFYSIDSGQFDDLFHVYPGDNDELGKQLGNNQTYMLFPKDENIKDLSPDRLQWYELYTFFNTLSTIDMSLAQPFIQIKLHEYIFDSENKETNESTVELREFGDTQIGELENNPHLYFVPQTYYHNSINKFRPYLGIQGFDMQITSPKGLIATKFATLRLRLFDITRLREVRDLMLPGPRGPAINIEWGWQHPHGERTFASRFINSLRDCSDWRVANYNASVRGDNTADITLELASLAGYKLNRARLIPQNKFDDFDQLNTEAREKREIVEKNLDTLRNKFETAKSPQRKEISSEIAKLNKQLKKFDVNEKRKKQAKVTKKLVKSLEKSLDEFFDIVFTNVKTKRMNKQRARRLKNKDNTGTIDIRPLPRNKRKVELRRITPGVVTEFEKFMSNTLGPERINEVFRNRKINTQPTYLGLLLVYLFGQSVKQAQGENENVETQIIFFNFNKHAADMQNKTIASFGIDKSKSAKGGRDISFRDRLRKYILKTKIINPPVMDIFSIINEEYIRNPIDINYGFRRKLFEQNTKTITRTIKGKERTYTRLESLSVGEQFLKFAQDVGFILPSVKFLIIQGQAHGKPRGQLVRRIFVYDEADPSEKSELEELRDNIKRNASEAESISTADIDKAYAQVRAKIPPVPVGTERSTVPNVQFTTIDDPLMQTVFMQRIEKAESAEVDKNVEGYPAEFFPMVAQLDTFGFPNILFGSKLFLDVRTRTTLDNIYRITGVKHSFSPGKLTTNLDLTPDDAWLKTSVEDNE